MIFLFFLYTFLYSFQINRLDTRQEILQGMERILRTVLILYPTGFKKNQKQVDSTSPFLQWIK